MGTKQFNNYEDLITFTRASGGHALRPVSYGTELVTNGDFSNETTGWLAARCTAAISSGQVVLTSTDTNPVFTQTMNLTVGKLYRVEGDIIGSTGTATPQINMFDSGFSSYGSTNSTGTFSFVATTASNYLQLRVQGTTVGDTATFDNISVKEVTFDESGGTLTLFEHPDNVPRVEYALNDSKDRFENIDNEILRAAIGTEPQATEFDVLVNGQKIGDITNNGDVSAFDASQYSTWLAGTLTNQTYIDYIEDVLNPYIEANLDKYILPYPEGVDRLGLLVEEARTNLIPRSDVDDWTNVSGGTFEEMTEAITETTLGAFTGLTVISQGEAWHRTTSPTFSVTSGTTYTVTAFYKAGTSGQVYIDFRIPTDSSVLKGNVGSLYVSSNAAGTATILSQETLPQGVYKVVFTVVANATASNCIVGIGPNSTTSGETVIALAAQVEQASFGTSYIKTTGSTATRSADVATMNLTEFGYNHSKGTVVVDASFTIDPNGSNYPRVFEFNTGTSSIDRTLLFASESSNTLQVSSFVNSVSQVGMQLKTGLTSSVSGKVAFAFANDDFAASDDGDAVLTDTSGSFVPSVKRDKLTLGGTGANSLSNMNGHIKSFKYYPRRLTNAQLQEITS